ncbi:Ataxin-10 domain [Phytophthora cactorum]|nr:Ataxin-10 domain [Phytophthora cactorum]
MDFEALAAECRSAAFRESLAASPVWTQAAETIANSVQQLETQIQSAGCIPSTGDDDQDADAAAEDDDGLGYTFRVDAKNPTAESLQDDFSPPKPVVTNVDRAADQVGALTAAFRFLRNACAACSANQDACRDAGLIKLAHDVVMHCCLWADVEDEALKGQVVLLAQVALQFCVNGVTGNTKNQAAAWELFFPDDFQKILVECHQYRKVIAFTVALILNCVNSRSADGSEIEEVAARRVDLVCARNLVITILHRCMAKPPKSSESDASLPSGAHIDDQDPAFDTHAEQVLVSSDPEQLILLRMLTMWAVSTPKSSSLAIIQEETSRKQPLPEGTFEFVKSTWMYIITIGDEDRPEEADEMRKKVWIELENEAKLMLLDVLGELTVGYTRINPDGARELLLSLLQELQRVWELGRQNPTTRNTRATGSTMPPQTNGEPFGYRSGLIRVIGNLSFRDTDHQDLVREEGYLPLFLNHCNIDETNPMIREWSLDLLSSMGESDDIQLPSTDLVDYCLELTALAGGWKLIGDVVQARSTLEKCFDVARRHLKVPFAEAAPYEDGDSQALRCAARAAKKLLLDCVAFQSSLARTKELFERHEAPAHVQASLSQEFWTLLRKAPFSIEVAIFLTQSLMKQRQFAW